MKTLAMESIITKIKRRIDSGEEWMEQRKESVNRKVKRYICTQTEQREEADLGKAIQLQGPLGCNGVWCSCHQGTRRKKEGTARKVFEDTFSENFH